MQRLMLDGLRGEADAAFFRLTVSRSSQSPLANARPSVDRGRGYVGSRPTTTHAGPKNRSASEVSASTKADLKGPPLLQAGIEVRNRVSDDLALRRIRIVDAFRVPSHEDK